MGLAFCFAAEGYFQGEGFSHLFFLVFVPCDGTESAGWEFLNAGHGGWLPELLEVGTE